VEHRLEHRRAGLREQGQHEGQQRLGVLARLVDAQDSSRSVSASIPLTACLTPTMPSVPASSSRAAAPRALPVRYGML
jgi:hypothetical protein